MAEPAGPAEPRSTEQIEVEVVYAAPDRVHRVRVRVPRGASLGIAVSASGLPERFPELDPERWGMGVFGRLREPDQVLHPGDRVELYRPLEANPKEARRRRAGPDVRARGAGCSTDSRKPTPPDR